MHERDLDPTTRSPNPGTTSSATETAKQATETAKQGAKDVAGTAKEQGREVVGQVGAQARSVASDVRSSMAGQVRTGHDKLTESLRRIADDLGTMGGDAGSPAGQVVQRLSDTGRRAADYLQDRGPEGLLDDVQEFARRKPGTFLLAAAAAGFVIGRLGRSTISAARSDDAESTASYASGYGATQEAYATGGTGYPAASTTTSGLLDDAYATPAPTTTTYTTATTGEATPVSTTTAEPAGREAGYDPTLYPTDPVGVPDRSTPR